MLTVDHYELIRRSYYIEGKSQRQISRELGHSRKTVGKALSHASPPGYRRRASRPEPVLGPFKPIIDAWLADDQHRPRKQRHTAQRIYERLRDEHGFQGHVTTVRRYVRNAKARASKAATGVHVPLVFGPGEEAQVDWHDGWILWRGEPRKVQFFCMRLAYSKASFVWPYWQADLVSFLDGHVRAFEYFGGVPQRLAYDNLKAAVIQVGQGQNRKLHPRFRELRSWYLFETRFCTPAKGNEKGDVENLANRSQRTYLTPVPHVTAWDALTDKLLTHCKRDLEKPGPAPQPERTRRELLAEEQASMLPRPPQPFPACREDERRVDSHALVCCEGSFYSVPVRWAHHRCRVRRFVEHIEVICGQETVATHRRSDRRGQYVLEVDHYLPLLARKPGSLANARVLRGTRLGEDLTLMRKELEYRYGDEGTKQFIEVLELFTEHPRDAVEQAIHACVQRRAFSPQAMALELRNKPTPCSRRLDLSDRPELMAVADGTHDLAVYDQLN